MKNRPFIFLIFLFIILSCKKDSGPYVPVERCADLTRNMDALNLFIQGTWDWVEEFRVTRYNGEEYLTPNSPGYYHLLFKFSGDTVRFFKNGQPDSVFRFKIQREFEISNYPSDTLPVLVYYSFHTGLRSAGYVPIKICQNQLLMQHQYVASIGGERLWIRR